MPLLKNNHGQFSFFLSLIVVFLGIVSNSSCVLSFNENKPSDEIILYNWEGDIPQAVLDAFTKETNIRVNYLVYESQEEAIENLRAGHVFDVMVMESRFIPLLSNNGLLTSIDYQNVLNFKYISPNFRGLIYDPDNTYSIPYSWGTTGLVVRTDKLQDPITRWADLWNPEYAGRIGIWRGEPRETLALTLKSLGYSANSEKPAELEAALARLIALKPNLHFLEDFDAGSAAPALASDKVTVAMGYSGDLLNSQALGLSVKYILPEEGAILWGDTFVIPANSPRKTAAELFINFLLRPEMSAEIANQKHYASANEAARSFIDPQILNNPAIYPSNGLMKKAEIILPLSPEGQELYDQAWKKFLDANPK